MKNKLIFSLLTLLSINASAACVGTVTFKTCTDDSGNTYTVNQFGSQTIVNGYNANTGNSWNQTSTRMGNSTYTNGTSADGDSWSSTSSRVGNTVIQNGFDSDGNYFNNTYRTDDDSYGDDDY